MTPRPQEQSSGAGEETCSAAGDRVVITGMAGLYPQARYIKDLQDILYNKVNPVSDKDLRWQYNHPEVAQYTGNVPELDRFDAQFFKVHYLLGNSMDAMARKILEQTFEAIYDAGVSPGHLSGKSVGVYIGSCFSETEKAVFYLANSKTGFGIAGCNKSMFANRISYWLNAKGPSMSIDDSCCSSMTALEAAYKAITHGECEAAIVGGANLCLHPQSSVHYGRIMTISMDGKTKSFSEDAAGCAKSEAINVLFLQRAKDAKRIYAEVVHVKSEYVSLLNGETGPRYGFYRDTTDTVNFLKEFYNEVGVPPSLVEYVEAFGSAVPEADKSELEAVDKVFCNGKEEPLLVGSVMSNIGYGEAASGISAITKVLLGYHTGALAGNLHGEAPRRDVAALREGRLRVLADHQRFCRGYTAVNSMSVTGVNAHVLLHGRYKPKDLNRYKSEIPRLVTVSSRQDSAVAKMLDDLKSHPIDPEELALLYNIHETNIAGHLGKGYTILDTNSSGATVSLSHRAEYYDGARRPLWFVYSGMGSQWAGMGAPLMRIPIFAAAIQRCHKVLEPKGLNIVHIITSPDKTIFDNILHSFVGIAAVQIGLTDILLELGLVPDKIIGHSVGELGCAYADGCLTAEEMILAAYSRGRVSLETPFIRGSMAAVGLGARQISSTCPPEIVVACHNSAESCTISGPAEAMRSFVAELTARGIFAKEVPCSNIAYHSRYIAEAGPGLLNYLKEVISTPKARSERWVSTSVPQERWQEPAAQYSSAEYHTNNLLSPVLFEEAAAAIPADAVLVEVAPHGLLQAILKRALPDSAANIPLTRRGHANPVVMLLDAIGKLYLHGYNSKVRVLYPEVEFPVSTGTPFLSHYVQWAHQEKWGLALYHTARRRMAASCKFVVSIHDNEYRYLEGHKIGSEIQLPFSFALVAAWDTLAMSLNVPKKSIGVKFREVQLNTQPILNHQRVVRLVVSLHRGNGHFEIMNEQSKVATGYIACIKNAPKEFSKSNTTSETKLEREEVYQMLYERGYDYSGLFHSIDSVDESISEAKISWNGNWVTFIDSLFQLNTLKYTDSDLARPHRVGKLTIDVNNHFSDKPLKDDLNNNNTTLVDAQLSELYSQTRSGGLLIENLIFRNVIQIKDDVTLQSLKFVPRFSSNYDTRSALYVILQVAAENTTKKSLRVLGLSDSHASLMFDNIKHIRKTGIPKTKLQYRQLSIDERMEDTQIEFENYDVILVQNLSKNDKMNQTFVSKLQSNTFIVNEEDAKADQNTSTNMYRIVSVLKNTKTQIELIYWNPTRPMTATSTFTVCSDLDLSNLKHCRNNLPPQHSIMIVTTHPPVSGLMRHVNEWRREETRNLITVIEVNDKSFKGNESTTIILANNVYNNGVWGGKYYLPIEDRPIIEDDVELQSDIVGNLNSLKWLPAYKKKGPGTLVQVHYAGVNKNDVNRALGLTSVYDSDCKIIGYGIDFSGITESGSRVMGLVSGGAARSALSARPELTWPVPPHWTLEDAATVPLAYFLAYYCLVMQSVFRIKAKYTTKSVLVHGGTGALGQAAISIALARGWRVFTTVADSSKKRFLKKLFPQLNENDIGNSRDTSFRDMVLSATNEMGCSAVICCLKGELKNASFHCCGPSSTMFDTDQITSNESYTFGMNNLTKERSYMIVDLTKILSEPESKAAQMLHSLVTEGIALGEVRPLTRVCFEEEEAPRAFRLVAASRHRGRTLLRLNHERAAPRHRVLSERTPAHLVICESSTLGMQVTEKIIACEPNKLHLHINTPQAPSLNYKLRAWKKMNIEVVVTSGELKEMSDVSNLLKESASSGPVEELYIVLNPAYESVIEKLDLATKVACPSLKRFVVVSKDMYCGYNTCVQRAKSGLPATLLDLSMLDTVQNVDGGVRYQGAATALQGALSSKDPVLLALPERTTSQPLMHQIAALTDFKYSNKNGSEATLEELGMPIEKAASVSAYLRDVYHYSLDEENVMKLTIESINEIESMNKIEELEEGTGLGKLISYVDPDELLATTEMIPMPTVTNNCSVRDDEINVNEMFLCIVPGLEGHHERFRGLCERLKLPAVVLQPGLDHPHETPAELALRYSKVLLKKTKEQKQFYILGYETGVLVALELAANLEDYGGEGTVFCLGADPEEVGVALEQVLRPYESSSALQAAVARHMCALMGHDAGEHAERALSAASSWDARVDACVRALRGRVPHSAQYARGLLKMAYGRIEAARRAAAVQTVPRALRSQLVLLRSRTDKSNCGARACSLQRFSQRALHVRDLALPLVHATADPTAPAIINSFLDPQLMEAFDNENLCDTYLVNTDAFKVVSVD